MPNPPYHEPSGYGRESLCPPAILVLSLSAIVSSYLLANSSLSFATKTSGFSGIIALFLIVWLGLHFWHKRARFTRQTAVFDHDVERCLRGLDEANDFFAGSLKTADAFRLIASRIKDLLHSRTIVLYLPDENRTQLCVAEVNGETDETYRERTTGQGAVSNAFSSGNIKWGVLSAAIPLRRGTEVFGVLEIYFDGAGGSPDSAQFLLEAIGTRAAPLILSSLAFERSHENALIDATTDLPNERAFFLVLESQIAETQRKPGQRPLTILSIDVKNFDDINRRLGHAAGDRVLHFVGRNVKDNLRQMDFFARSRADEFLAILPTASAEIACEVIDRINFNFLERRFAITENEKMEIELNIGAAAFGQDGETSENLLTVARLRKNQAKVNMPNKVLWFPRELVH